MPCVFPVLALKIMALVRHGQADRVERLRQGLLYTAGILTTFLAIGGALVALRGAGAEIGWGFQLQEPLVVSALALLLFAVGLNLAGFFEIGGSFQGLGQSVAAGRGGLGSFATGALAVFVAAPCTAPFMAPALGFALTQPALSALGIFAALGLGLAAPYLLLAVLPGAGRMLPKPGPWMTKLKEFLAFPMFATAVWLVWVLAQQAGPMTLAAVLAAFVLMGFAVWLYRRISGGILGPVAALAALALALALPVLAPREAPLLSEGSDGPALADLGTEEGGGLPYEPYSEERLAEARASGRPVFVNFTAAWCISCIVNERVTLRSADVVEAFAARNVLPLKGDWTNRDPVITRALRRFDRSGVPLYVLYPGAGADDPAPKVLPAVLTPELLKKAVDAAGDGLTPVASIR
jgi:thiol:disulfide interchange protein DsbD